MQSCNVVGEKAATHGASEPTNQPREVIEAALAHVVPNKVEAAYARSDLFERRRRLMDDWAAYPSWMRGLVPKMPLWQALRHDASARVCWSLWNQAR